MKKNSVLVIGIDGATWKVINSLLRKGKMDSLLQLKKNGSYGVLKSTIPTLTAPAWVSFQTGVNPGKHGIFAFKKYRNTMTNPQLFSSKDVKAEKIWETVGANKLKSLVINMPMSYPVDKINGVIISSFLTPPGKRYVSPFKYEKLLNNIGYQIDILEDEYYSVMPSVKLSKEGRKKYLEKLSEISKKRVKAYVKFIKVDYFNFQFLLFKEVDVAQHLFWGTKELEIYYEHLDQLINEVTTKYRKRHGKSADIIVMSDHGFHKSATRQFSPANWIFNNILNKERKLKLNVLWEPLSNINKELKSIGYLPMKNSNFVKLRRNILKKGENELLDKYGFLVTQYGLYFKTHFKRKYEKTIVNKLKSLRIKGEKVFKLVDSSRNIYSGHYIGDAPDIVWLPNEKYEIDTSAFSNKITSKRSPVLKGDHLSDRNGIYILNGKSFNKGKKENLNIFDIYPTILKILNINVTHDIDGKLPNSMVEKDIYIEKDQDSIERQIDKEISKIT